jgi:hypothetical protein
VNRHREAEQAVEIDLFDFLPRSGRQVVITGPEAMGYMLRAVGPGVSDLEYNPEACTVKEKTISPKSGKFTVEVPEHGMVILKLES